MLRYLESKPASAEIFSMVIQKMAEWGCAFTPVHYTVVYEYVSGINPPLIEAVNGLLKKSSSLVGEDLEKVFVKYVVPDYVLPLNEYRGSLSRQLQSILQNISSSTTLTAQEAERVKNGMESYSHSLQEESLDEKTFRTLVDAVLKDTLSIRESSSSLNAELVKNQKKIDHLQDELRVAREEAMIDPLTGILNRRGLSAKINDLLREGKFFGTSCALLMVDIDHFKKINDSYGHIIGDKAIVAVSKVLRGSVGENVAVGRVGGEEFAVFSPKTSPEEGVALGERLRQNIMKIEITNPSTRQKISTMTVSIGIDSAPFSGEWEGMFERADKALYASKYSGRNKVTRWTPETSDIKHSKNPSKTNS